MDLEELKVIISAKTEGFEKSVLKIKEQLSGLNKEVGKVSEDISMKLSRNNSKDFQPKIDTETLTKQIDDLTNKVSAKTGEMVEKIQSKTKGIVDNIVSEMDKAIGGLMDRIKNIKLPEINLPTIGTEKPNTSDTTRKTTTRGPPKTINTEALKSEVSNVATTLDNINERIEREQAKLIQLKEAFQNAFNPVIKDKIKDQILKTESAISSLISKSDKLGFKLADLDAKLASVGKGAAGASSKINNLASKTNNFTSKANGSLGIFKKMQNLFGGLGSSAKSCGSNFNSMHSGLGNIARQFATWMIILPLIMKGLTAMTSGLLADLNTNTQFANSLAQIKTNLMVAFTPIFYAILPAINAFMSSLATLTAYIASFISSIFGKTYQESFQATQGLIDAKKAMGAYGDSAKKAAKDALGLAGIDEINNLSKSGAGADNSKVPTLTQPSLNTADVDSKMQSLADKFKKIFGEIFDSMQQAWNKEGKSTLGALKYALDSIWQVAKDIGKTFLDVWSNGTGIKVSTNILKLLQTIFNTIGDIAKAFKTAWDNGELGKALVQAIFNALDSVLKVLNSIGTTFRDVWNSGVGVEICTSILEILKNIFTIIGQIATSFNNAWQTNGETIVSGILEILNNILSAISSISTNWINAWNNNGNGDALLQSILGLLGSIVTTLSDVTNGIGESFGKATESLFPTFIQFCTSIGNSLSNITSGFKDIWDNGGQKLFDGIVQLGTQIADLIMKLSSSLFADFAVLFRDTLAPAISAVFNAVGTVLGKLVEFMEWVNTNKPIVDGLKLVIEGLMAAWAIGKVVEFINISGGLMGAIGSIGSTLAGTTIAQGAYNIAQGIGTTLTTIWTGVSTVASIATTALGAAFAFLTSPIGLVVLAITAVIAIGVLLYQHWDVVKQKASECWDFVKQEFDKFKTWLDGVFATDWSTQFGGFGNIINAFLKTAQEVGTGIGTALQGITDFITGVFTGDWSKAWKGISEIFEGVWGAFEGIAKAPINAVIGLINGLISAINLAIAGLNKIKINVPDWVPKIGGKSFGFNLSPISSIPALAKGGIVDSPTLAQIGEAGKEAVMPLENNTGWITELAGKIAGIMGAGSNSVTTTSGGGDVIFMLDGNILGKVAIAQLLKMKKQGYDLSGLI